MERDVVIVMLEQQNRLLMAQGEQLKSLTETMYEHGRQNERIEQKVTDLDVRLYNGGSGAIPKIFEKIAQDGPIMAAITTVKNDVDDFKEDVAEHRTKDAYRHGLTGTLSTALSLIIKAGLTKIGWHF